MTLKFYSLLEVVKVQDRAKFNHSKFIGLWAIALSWDSVFQPFCCGGTLSSREIARGTARGDSV